jgi:hypothetical protein
MRLVIVLVWITNQPYGIFAPGKSVGTRSGKANAGGVLAPLERGERTDTPARGRKDNIALLGVFLRVASKSFLG